MKQPEICEIIRVLEKSNFKIFQKPFDINLGGIRTKDNTANTFNDFLFAFCYDDKNGIICRIVEGTTDAGLYYRLNPMNIEGTAIIQHNVQHRGAYQLQDPGKDPSQRGHRGQKAFRQVKAMKYWRDANRNKYLDFDGEEKTGVYYTNGHFMGTIGKNVNKWSAGCWGTVVEKMDELFEVCQLQVDNGLGDKFSFSLLHENDF
jgi:hypothetical protein